ncbi:MAG: hypothetical protein WB775_00095, partial [Burkholderiaceae bacterium]
MHVIPMILGCDFSSSPSRRKPVVLALGELSQTSFQSISGNSPASKGHISLSKMERFETLEAFTAWLKTLRRPWVGGFDLPFGLPRELVETLGWPTTWLPCLRHYAALSRADIRASFAAFCDARPTGGKFTHRATDGPAGSSPSMKWVNPPVAFMLHAGVPLLLDAGAHLPGLHPGKPDRVALEAYPGLLAREILQALDTRAGRTARRSYKSDDRAKQTPERLIARKDLLTALEHGQSRLGLRLKLTHAQRDALADDASGDSLDAVLCMVQAA